MGFIWSTLKAIFRAPADDPVYADGQLARLGVLTFGIILTTVFAGYLAVSIGMPLRSIGIVTLTVILGLAVGALFGFLFGIPRSGALQPAPAGGAASSPNGAGTAGYRPNTNLEDVSDWITKIIVGLGLAQLYQLRDQLWAFHQLLARYAPPTDTVTPLAGSIGVVVGFVIGFLWFYIESRTSISRALVNADRSITDKVASALSAVTNELPGQETALAPAADKLKTAAELTPGNTQLRTTAAKALAAAGRTTEAMALLATGSTVQDQISRMLVSLYQPKGYEEALSISASLGQNPAAANNADYWINLAAANGQKHSALRAANAEPSALDGARAAVLDAVRHAIALRPEAKDQLFQLTNPTQDPKSQNDDLIDFRDDAEFLNLVGRSR